MAGGFTMFCLKKNQQKTKRNRLKPHQNMLAEELKRKGINSKIYIY